MNQKLTHEIVSHIFERLLVIKSNDINQDKFKSILSPEFLFTKKIVFEQDGNDFHNDIWGAQIKTTDNTIKIIVADCQLHNTQMVPVINNNLENINYEYCLIVSSDQFPCYGAYFADQNYSNNYSLISVSMDKGKTWLPCQTYLQATFLAAMEQLKDMIYPWNKCLDYNKEYDMLRSFLSHREQLFEVENEG